jgi:hypothetical protein
MLAVQASKLGDIVYNLTIFLNFLIRRKDKSSKEAITVFRSTNNKE